MQSSDQGRQLRLWNVLQFVDCKDKRSSALFRRETNRHNQVRQIAFEVAAVGDTGFRGDVQVKFDVLEFELERLCRACEHAPRRLEFGLQSLDPAQLQQADPQGWNEQAWQRTILGRLD